MFFELPWVGVAMDAMAVAIHIKYALSLNPHITFYLWNSFCIMLMRPYSVRP